MIRDLTIVVPAYKASMTIQPAIEKIIALFGQSAIDFEVIVVVDGEVDDTKSKLESLNLDRVSVISYSDNRGKGYALRNGFSLATGKFIGFIDADLDLEPGPLRVGLEMMIEDQTINIVVASKTHPDSIVDYPLTRKALSRMYATLTKVLFGLPVRDTQTGLKLFQRQSLLPILDKCKADGFAIDLELLSLAHKNGAKIVEIPVQLNFQFESTVNFRSALSTLRDTFSVWWSHRSLGLQK